MDGWMDMIISLFISLAQVDERCCWFQQDGVRHVSYLMKP
jgi:hypothetical protein